MTHVFSWLGALALGAGLALPAVAEPRLGDEPRSQTVGLSDLDLRGTQGATIAVSRISVAAQAVCEEYVDSVRDLRVRTASKQCRRQAMDSAVTRLDSPRVSEVHFGRKVRVEVLASAAK